MGFSLALNKQLSLYLNGDTVAPQVQLGLSESPASMLTGSHQLKTGNELVFDCLQIVTLGTDAFLGSGARDLSSLQMYPSVTSNLPTIHRLNNLGLHETLGL
jgi:hypothetical protein